MMSSKKMIVIGAGISGISAAIKAKKSGYDVLVLEANDKPGGIIDTFQDEVNIEFGAHSFYNSYANCLKLIKESNFQDQIIPKEKLPFLFDNNGSYVSVFKCLKKIPMALGMVKWYLLSRAGQSVGNYYEKIFGKYNYQNVLRHCFNAVLSQDANSFPADLLFNVKKRDKSIIRCFGFREGMTSFIQHLIAHYKIKVKYSSNVQSIQKNVQGYIVTSESEKFEANAVVLATNVQTTSNLIKQTNLGAHSMLDNISTSKLLSCAVRINSSKINLSRLAGIIGSENSDFYSIVSSDPFICKESKLRGFVVHFKYFPQFSQKALIDKICFIFKINCNDIMNVQIKEQSVPKLRVGHQKLIQKLDKIMDGSGIFLTGNYFNRLAVEDCVERSFSLSL